MFQIHLSTDFDVIVVGAGQAGIEAALASARMGKRTLCVTLRLDRIGHLPCNCSIGGPAKGHIAREIDALGGEMALTTDHALTHIRRVGTGKGPAVQTVRAQVCKDLYPKLMRAVLESQPGLQVLEGAVTRITLGDGMVQGVTVGSQTLTCRAVVLTTGTFLNGVCHEGAKKTIAARRGDQAVHGLSDQLRDLGVNLRRFKTGTTPRVAKRSLSLEALETLPSEPDAGPMSFRNTQLFAQGELLPCWQTRTTGETHALLEANLHQSAMYSGEIEGVGPRYCPSVEDKIVRFKDKQSHPIFLEQEVWSGESIYVQGFSTSMPAEVQLLALRTIPGLENAEILVPGYAVEYDMADPTQLWPSLMSKQLDGLFFAGQLNGTSGYEEAAGQGIVAGINAARFASDLAPVEFPRNQSFIGVMIDDLVTKGVEDPYRMLTARAEFRLLLRHDNADQRLTPLSREIGLCDDVRWAKFSRKMAELSQGLSALHQQSVSPNDDLASQLGTKPVGTRTSYFDLLRRPEITLSKLQDGLGFPRFDPQVEEQMELAAMFEGYIQIQEKEARKIEKLEKLSIPDGFEWEQMVSLSYESLEKLSRIRPQTVGQASRVPGVRPSDIAMLIGYLRA